MNEAKGNGMIILPSENEGTIMVPPKTEDDDLMLPPRPITNEDMMNVSGGANEEATPEIEPMKPHEMKVVKLEDGRFVNVPADAICNSEEEAKKFMMPPPPGEPHHPHCQRGQHGHHEHHHKHDHHHDF